MLSATRLCVGLVAIAVAVVTARGQESEPNRPSEGGKEVLSIRADAGWGVSRLALSPDGKYIVSSNAGFPAPIDHRGCLLLNDVATGKQLAEIEFPSSRIFAWGLALSPNGKQIAAAYSDLQPSSSVIIWDAETRKQSFEFKVPFPVVTSLAFTPDGQHIITGGGDNGMYADIRPVGELMVWRADTGKQRFHLKGHKALVTRVAVYPDGKRLASSSWDGTVKVWNLETGKELLTLEGHTGLVGSVAISPDGKRIVSSASGKFTEQRQYKKWNTTEPFVESRPLRVWDAETGKEFKDLLFDLKDPKDSVRRVAISPDGKRIAGARGGNGLRVHITVWDADTGRVVATLRGHMDVVTCLTFSPDSTRLISGGNDHLIKVWELTTK